MSLKDKASKIGFSDLDTPTNKPTGPGGDFRSPVPRSRSGVAAISQSIGIHHRVQDLEAAVAEYEKGGAVVKLDPKRIGSSKWKNRHEKSYETAEFKLLKSEIEASGKNVQPIKVRRLGDGPDGQGAFEVVYGRRRLRACLELGLPVAAIVQELSDIESFQEMERENRSRADLSAWEQGVMYKDALDQGLFVSHRQMAAALNIDQSNLGKAVKLASLPREVLEAFDSPLDLQFRWSTELTDALERDPAKVLMTAQTLRAMAVKPAAKDIFSQLVSATPVSTKQTTKRDFHAGSKVVATFANDARGGIGLKVKPGALSAAKEKRLLDFLEKLFE